MDGKGLVVRFGGYVMDGKGSVGRWQAREWRDKCRGEEDKVGSET